MQHEVWIDTKVGKLEELSRDVSTEVYYSAEYIVPSDYVKDNPCNEEEITDDMGVDLIHDDNCSMLFISNKMIMEILSPPELSPKPDIKGNYTIEEIYSSSVGIITEASGQQ